MKTLKEHNFFGYDCTIVADSKNEFGDRLTSMVITIPRIMLAELNTHRLFSRNSASSRAIPFEKMLERVQSNPFIPVAWQKEHKGMQGSEYLDEVKSCVAKMEWLHAIDQAVKAAVILTEESGVTKQLCNSLLEPFLWHTVIITASTWENFFDLLCPQYEFDDILFKSKKDVHYYANGKRDLNWFKINKTGADIPIQAIAELMWDAYNENVPKSLKAGEWHIPFVDEINIHNPSFERLLEIMEIDVLARAISVATCAKLSYGNIDVFNSNYEKDIELYDRLIKMKHWSPTEHIAKCMHLGEYYTFVKGKAGSLSRNRDGTTYLMSEDAENVSKGGGLNFKGFIQQRYYLGGQS